MKLIFIKFFPILISVIATIVALFFLLICRDYLNVFIDKSVLFQINITIFGFTLTFLSLIVAFTEKSSDIRRVMRKGHMSICIQSLLIILISSIISFFQYIFNVNFLTSIISVCISLVQLCYILHVLYILLKESLKD